MKKIFFIIMILGLYACEGPRNRRTALKASSSTSDTQVIGIGNPDQRSPSNVNDHRVTPDSQSTPIATNSTSETSHCNFSGPGEGKYYFQHNYVGYYNICQSDTTDKTLYVQFSNPITSAQYCFIPTTTDNTGNVIHIGNASCLYISRPDEIYKVNFYKYSNFANTQITGSFIMKEIPVNYPAPYYSYMLPFDAYRWCMDWLKTQKDSTYCNTFNQTGAFVLHQFR